jgi:hypothetical protein
MIGVLTLIIYNEYLQTFVAAVRTFFMRILYVYPFFKLKII